MVTPILISLGVMGLLVVGFYLVQRRGLFGWIVRVLNRLAGDRDWHLPVGEARALDDTITRIYRNRYRVFLSLSWRLAGWVVGAGEIWLALHFLDAPTTIGTALLLESLGQAVRSATFFIPGALGVQEGGYLLLGGLVGLSPEVALALSLTKRVRMFLLGLPGLIDWQIAEGRRLKHLQMQRTR